MNERERREFMSACSGKVCVAYTVRIPIRHRTMGVAALAAVAIASLPAAADTPAENSEPPATPCHRCRVARRNIQIAIRTSKK
jgi:hypothetical protein